MTSDELGNILDRIASGNDAEADIAALRRLLSSSDRQSLLHATAKKDIKKNILLPIAKIEQGKREIAE